MIEGLPGSDKEGGISEPEFMAHLEKAHNNGYKTILVIDDMMTTSKSGKAGSFVDKLFTSARHLNTSVWELTQAHTASRLRRLNAGYLVTFATPADTKSLAYICQSIRPETRGKDILAAYRISTESRDGHGCLVICLQQPNEFMFRNTDMRVAFDMSTLL
jgi:hypothetical protein